VILIPATALGRGDANRLIFVSPKGKVSLIASLGATPKLVQADHAREPSIDAAGKRVLFWSDGGKDMEAPIKLLDLSTGKSRVVIKGNCRSPRWRPGKDEFCFTRFGKSWDLWLGKLDGTETKLFSLNRQSGDIFTPRWNATGDLVYVHDLDNVYIVGADGVLKQTLKVTDLIGDEGIDSASVIEPSPSNANLLIVSCNAPASKRMEERIDGPNSGIVLYDTAKKTRKWLTKPNLCAYDPTWSRDGKTVYFVAFRDVELDKSGNARRWVYRIGVNGTGLTKLAEGSEPAS
jgi:Tol biopolymer transport system component